MEDTVMQLAQMCGVEDVKKTRLITALNAGNEHRVPYNLWIISIINDELKQDSSRSMIRAGVEKKSEK